MSESEKQATVEAGESASVDERRQTAGPSARAASPSGAEAPDYPALTRDDNHGALGNDSGATPSPPAAGDKVGKNAAGDRVGENDHGKPAGLCHHFMESGFYCQSPALHDRRYCYSHLRLRGQRLRMARAIAKRQPYALRLPALDDVTGVRVAAAEVAEALAAGLIEPKRAGCLVYTFQQILYALRLEAQAPQRFVSNPALSAAGAAGVQYSGAPSAEQKRLVEDYPEFEEEFGLPTDIDIDRSPHLVFPPPEDAWPAAESVMATAAQAVIHEAPKPRPIWTKEGIELEQLEKRRGRMDEKSYCEQVRKVNARIENKLRTEFRNEQEAEWQAEADRRNAFEEKKAQIFRNMDEKQRQAYHIGVLRGLEAAQEQAEQEARKKPVKAVVSG